MPVGVDPLPVTLLSSADWNEDLPPLFIQDGAGGYVPDDLGGCAARVVVTRRGTPAASLEMTVANSRLQIGQVDTELGPAPFIAIRVPAAVVPIAGVYDRQVYVLRPAEIQPLYSGVVVIQQGN